MVMHIPELLPLRGSPRLTGIGREVGLPSSGYADVLAMESDGSPVIIEVKLKNNSSPAARLSLRRCRMPRLFTVSAGKNLRRCSSANT